MAIDFPNSPTMNQIFTVGNRSWIWDGSTWNIYSNVPNRYVQDAAPSSPQSGDQWFESDTGRLFVYYDSAWVEIGNATDIAGAIQPGQITALSAVTSLTTDDVFVVVDNPSSATAANKITYGNLVVSMSTSLAPGLVLLKTQTVGSAVASVTVTDAFSSTYDAYRIQIFGINGSTVTDMKFTLGSTSTGYYGSYYYDLFNGSVTGTARYNNAANTQVGGVGTSAEQNAHFDIFNPNKTARTSWSGNWYGNGYSGWFSGVVDNATAYTAFTLTPVAGTFTGGTIKVFGYRN